MFEMGHEDKDSIGGPADGATPREVLVRNKMDETPTRSAE
jgi:hypothetical protein